MDNTSSISALIEAAIDAKNLSYSPYSKFRVGSAVLARSGKIYQGANIENVNFSGTICGERSALTVALCTGEREFDAIAIASDKGFPFPCGACRQFIVEFARQLDVYVVNGKGEYEKYTMPELMQHPFTPDNL